MHLKRRARECVHQTVARTARGACAYKLREHDGVAEQEGRNTRRPARPGDNLTRAQARVTKVKPSHNDPRTTSTRLVAVEKPTLRMLEQHNTIRRLEHHTHAAAGSSSHRGRADRTSGAAEAGVVGRVERKLHHTHTHSDLMHTRTHAHHTRTQRKLRHTRRAASAKKAEEDCTATTMHFHGTPALTTFTAQITQTPLHRRRLARRTTPQATHGGRSASAARPRHRLSGPCARAVRAGAPPSARKNIGVGPYEVEVALRVRRYL